MPSVDARSRNFYGHGYQNSKAADELRRRGVSSKALEGKLMWDATMEGREKGPPGW